MKNVTFLIVGAVIALVSYFFGSGGFSFFDQGKYYVSGTTPAVAWRINSDTGQLSQCYAVGLGSRPQCGPWSKDTAN